MVDRAVVLLAGTPPSAAAVTAACQGAFVVAADGGAELAAAANVRPDLIIGDMDSVTPATLQAFEDAGVRIERHPPDKRDADGTLAVDAALAAGAQDITLIAATGGRLDLMLAGLGLLSRIVAAGARGRLVERDAQAWAVTAATPLDLSLPPGTVVSALALSAEARGVTLTGFQYGLDAGTLEAGDPFGVSNVAQSAQQSVRVADGAALVVAVLMPASGPQ